MLALSPETRPDPYLWTAEMMLKASHGVRVTFSAGAYGTHHISLAVCICVSEIEGTEHNLKYESLKSTPVLLLSIVPGLVIQAFDEG